METSGVLQRQPPVLEQRPQPANPWLSDEVILSLSVWWVKMTGGETADFTTEVTEVFESLDRDLRRVQRPQRSRCA